MQTAARTHETGTSSRDERALSKTEGPSAPPERAAEYILNARHRIFFHAPRGTGRPVARERKAVACPRIEVGLGRRLAGIGHRRAG